MTGSQLRRRSRPEILLTAQICDRLGEMDDGNRLDAREAGLRRGLGGAEDAQQPLPARTVGERYRPGDRANAPVERELADDGMLAAAAPREPAATPRGSRARSRGRSRCPSLRSAAGARLTVIRWLGQAQCCRRDAAVNAVLRLLARAVGEPDDREPGLPAVEMRLDLDATRLEPDERSVKARATTIRRYVRNRYRTVPASCQFATAIRIDS